MKNYFEVLERQRFNIDEVGTSNTRELFIRSNPRILILSGDTASFNVAGIFQIGDTCCLVSPWFKASEKNQNSEIEFKSLSFLDYIRSTKEVARQVILEKFEPNKFGQEIIIHSFLKKVFSILIHAISKNYFMDKEERLSVIRGKWLVHKDMGLGPRPISFECKFSDAEPINPILILIKSFTIWLSDMSCTRLNLNLCNEILSELEHIEYQKISDMIISEAVQYVTVSHADSEWLSIIESISNIYETLKRSSPMIGLAYMFEMDRFFEELIEDSLHLNHISFRRQYRMSLLGGAIWKRSGDDSEAVDTSEVIGEKDSQMHVKPDIVVSFDRSVWVCDCKYKPLLLPLHDQNKGLDFQRKFSREDRNQLLSFVLSYFPANIKENTRFAIIYPDINATISSIQKLVFKHVKMDYSGTHRSLIQSRELADQQLTIDFIGVNVDWILDRLIKNEPFIGEEFSFFEKKAS